MRLWKSVGTAVFGVFAAMSVAAAADDQAKTIFRAGFSEKDITPAIGMEAPGGYGKSYHQTVHDACKVRAAVFDDGKNRVAIVGIDALGIRRDTVEKVRAEVEKITAIPGGSILIGASHSHSSGPCVWILPGEFDHASAEVQDMAYKQSTIVDPKYLAQVEQALIDAIVEANGTRAVGLGGVGRGNEPTVAFNRRFFMKNGMTVTHPGLGNPDIVKPAGPMDPEVGVIGVFEPKNPTKLRGCVVNFACHATTNPGGISANYIHYLEKTIQGYYGKDVVVVFVNGNSGDITQVDNQSPHKYPSGEKWAQLVGGKVGAEALKVLLSMEPGKLTPVAADLKVWDAKRRPPSKEHVEKATALVKADPKTVDPTERTFAKETLMLQALLQTQPTAKVEVQVVQVGPVVFVTNPAEYFCRYGLEIKKGSGFPFTFPVSLANGCVGYVPTLEAFGPDGGGYETRLTSYSNLEITEGNRMRDAGIELARKLKPGPVPGPEKRPNFTGKPWGYGNVPPQKD